MQLFEMVTDETLRATNRYGTPEFPFAVYLDDLETCKERRVEWHWHRELEVSAVVSGPVECLIGADQTAAGRRHFPEQRGYPPV